MKKAAITVIVLLIFSTLALAQEAPILPMVIKGNVLIDGIEAPAGTMVKAFIDSREVSSYTLAETGDYTITIPGTNDDEGAKLTFTVNGIPVSNVDLAWNSGGVTTRTLAMETPTTTMAAAALGSNPSASQNNGSQTATYLLVGVIAALVILAILYLSSRKPSGKNKQ